jgi:hypothetical protein
MTKEELKKEAEEYTKNLLKKLGIKEDMLLENQPKYLRQESMNFVALDIVNVTDAYLASAEPREKQIQIDAEQIRALQKDKGNLTDRVAELEAQIEKMKCCYNCSKWKDGQCADVPNDNSYYGADFVCKDWEIKEK